MRAAASVARCFIEAQFQTCDRIVLKTFSQNPGNIPFAAKDGKNPDRSHIRLINHYERVQGEE